MMAPHGRAGSAMTGFDGLHQRLPDPRAGGDARLLSRASAKPPRSRISASTARREFFEREATGSATRRRWSTANDVLADPARHAAAPLRRARHRLRSGDARPGRRAAARPTGPGRRTGTRRSRRDRLRPARPARRPARRGARASPTAAGLITSGWRRTGSRRHEDQASWQGLVARSGGLLPAVL